MCVCSPLWTVVLRRGEPFERKENVLIIRSEKVHLSMSLDLPLAYKLYVWRIRRRFSFARGLSISNFEN